jgi:hypothetical protein
MITKTMRQSSRSYKQRQAVAQSHFGRTPQIHAKDFKPQDKTILGAIATMLMKFFHRKQSK